MVREDDVARTVAAIVAALPIAKAVAREGVRDLETFHAQLVHRCAQAGVHDHAAVRTAGALVVLDRDRVRVRLAREAATVEERPAAAPSDRHRSQRRGGPPTMGTQQPDYSTWYTKPRAAEAIGVTTKTIEKLAKARGKLEHRRWTPPAGGHARVVYNPRDVERLAQERRPGPAPFVVGAAAATGDGQGQALAPLPPPPGEELQLARYVAALRMVTSEKFSNRSEKLFLTLPEAAACSGLSQACLRRLIVDKKLEAIRDRGWRISRRALEGL